MPLRSVPLNHDCSLDARGRCSVWWTRLQQTTAQPRTCRLLLCCALQVSRIDDSAGICRGRMTSAAGVVNAEDLKRFSSYFWNEENHEIVDKDEAMRCLRAFLQVRHVVLQDRPQLMNFGCCFQIRGNVTLS